MSQAVHVMLVNVAQIPSFFFERPMALTRCALRGFLWPGSTWAEHFRELPALLLEVLPGQCVPLSVLAAWCGCLVLLGAIIGLGCSWAVGRRLAAARAVRDVADWYLEEAPAAAPPLVSSVTPVKVYSPLRAPDLHIDVRRPAGGLVRVRGLQRRGAGTLA